MGKMTVFHGGYEAIPRPEIRIGRNTKDFGPGFYCTIIKEQAQRWARRYDTKMVSIYDVRLDMGLKIFRKCQKSGWTLSLPAEAEKSMIMIL